MTKANYWKWMRRIGVGLFGFLALACIYLVGQVVLKNPYGEINARLDEVLRRSGNPKSDGIVSGLKNPDKVDESATRPVAPKVPDKFQAKDGNPNQSREGAVPFGKLGQEPPGRNDLSRGSIRIYSHFVLKDPKVDKNVERAVYGYGLGDNGKWHSYTVGGRISEGPRGEFVVKDAKEIHHLGSDFMPIISLPDFWPRK